jgi:hypothetical protein
MSIVNFNSFKDKDNLFVFYIIIPLNKFIFIYKNNNLKFINN